MKKVLRELGTTLDATFIAHDISGAIEWAVGGRLEHFARRKHIDIQFKYVIGLI